MSEELSVAQVAGAVRRLAGRCADSGPGGAWPGGPHPAWTAAALAFILTTEGKCALPERVDRLTDEFWSACGFQEPPPLDTILAGLSGALDALNAHPAVPATIAGLHQLAVERTGEFERLRARARPRGGRPRR